MKTTTPGHKVEITRVSSHVKVSRDGVVLAETSRPVLLFETGLPTRYYIPREDVRMELLTPTDTSTKCPYKGTASYWSVQIGDEVLPDFVWSYPEPISEARGIARLLCFYNEKVELEVDGEALPRPQTRWS